MIPILKVTNENVCSVEDEECLTRRDANAVIDGVTQYVKYADGTYWVLKLIPEERKMRWVDVQEKRRPREVLTRFP